jgi:hypothetical protein
MPVSDAYLMDLQIEDLMYDQIEEDYNLYAEELEPLLAELDDLIEQVLQDT